MISAGKVALKGKVRTQCPPRTVDYPTVSNKGRRAWCYKANVSGKACEKLIRACIKEETQMIRRSIFTRNMKRVTDKLQSVTKNHGMIAGALFFLVGTIASAVDAAQFETWLSDLILISKPEIDAFVKAVRSDSSILKSFEKYLCAPKVRAKFQYKFPYTQ